jgi:non-canonical poly(A) RNA polymerase PAPD5/7
MGDSYRPTRRDRGPPPSQPLADRMTFNGNGNGGDTYRPGGQQQSEFTFESNHPAPRFPPSGPANGDSRAPARSGRGGPRNGRGSNRGRGGANGRGRGGPYRKAAAPHERALLQHRDDGQEHTYGVSDGPNRFMNIDDMSDDEEADMVESDGSADGDASKAHLGEKKKLVRTEAQRADGDTVPKWSNPDPYTALPPPNESTGVKRDMVQLIRKAKNQDAEKAIGNNAVAANDDFISFGDMDDGDDGEVEDARDLQIYDDNEPVRRGARGQQQRPVQGSMNDAIPNDYRRDTYESYQPPPSSRNRKRKPDYDMPITDEWLVHSRSGPTTPWAIDASRYEHLFGKPDKW